MAALRAGADMIKIYPCSQIGGALLYQGAACTIPQYAANRVRWCESADGRLHFIEAGASALGIREDLIPHAAILSRKADWIHELTHRFLGMVQGAAAA